MYRYFVETVRRVYHPERGEELDFNEYARYETEAEAESAVEVLNDIDGDYPNFWYRVNSDYEF